MFQEDCLPSGDANSICLVLLLCPADLTASHELSAQPRIQFSRTASENASSLFRITGESTVRNREQNLLFGNDSEQQRQKQRLTITVAHEGFRSVQVLADAEQEPSTVIEGMIFDNQLMDELDVVSGKERNKEQTLQSSGEQNQPRLVVKNRDVRPVVCDVCDLQFINDLCLNKHLMQHIRDDMDKDPSLALLDRQYLQEQHLLPEKLQTVNDRIFLLNNDVKVKPDDGEKKKNQCKKLHYHQANSININYDQPLKKTKFGNLCAKFVA